jgi:non-homologous end joining protein Ku
MLHKVSKDECVPVDPTELEKIAPKSSKVMDILQFVKAEEFDPVFMDKSYHVLPDGDITKPHALLRESIEKRKQFAIAKVAMHNREHVERVQGVKYGRPAPVVNILEALQKSLAESQSKGKAAKPTKRRRKAA